jgi:hypothetical protein
MDERGGYFPYQKKSKTIKYFTPKEETEELKRSSSFTTPGGSFRSRGSNVQQQRKKNNY